MLKRMRIIQVGDIHLPGACKTRSFADDKDARFPRELKTVIADIPIKIVLRKIYELISRDRVDAILFMGDLTDYGQLEGYEACVSYISRSLQLGTKGIFSNLQVGILPGNHDISRELAKAPGNVTKFTPLQRSLSDVGLPQLPIQLPIRMKLLNEGRAATIALLNSCWGCGSAEYIPEEFRAGVSEAIEMAIKDGSNKKSTEAYYERQFDTPAFTDETIQSISNEYSDNADSSILLVCAHHNLLPQRQPRLAPYTELVNSGALRDVLTSLKRPVIYLHGHIHDDPVEIISQPDSDPLICISAPLITDGFNVIDLTFTRTGAPLGCHLNRWRLDNTGTIRMHQAIVLPLIGRRRRSHDRALSRLYSFILDEREVYWSELLAKASEIYTTEVEEQVVEAIELLSADGRIKIDNYDRSPANWIIGAGL
ncbi:metallophosphoesterase family protein [Methylobacterium sp. SD21]|uniref:metallophosphoesterase family protein n=1 Tax=Methylobacterium litchii TaxID=3138810 RepID=UPI00313C11A1